MSGAMVEHAHRRSIMDEVHARPVDIVPDECRLRRLTFVIPARPGSMLSAFERFSEFCAQAGHQVPLPTARQHSFETEQRYVTWEFHTEFVTVTWRGLLSDKEAYPKDLGLIALGEAQLLGAARVDVIAEANVPQRLIPGFNLPSLCLSNIENDHAQVATDFVPDEEGFTRLEFAAGGLVALRRSIVVRRLLEIETYRTMALLGLPLAREAGPGLRQIELELTELMERLPDATTAETVQSALAMLQSLSIRSGQLSERLGYRFAAGMAYGRVLDARLTGLRERPGGNASTLSRYIGNRVDPGLATCAAMEQRLAVLASKVERAIGLLNVRIGVDMQLQNAMLLDNIARTAGSQYRLQKTVEGLSTIAISYYLLGILGYALQGPSEILPFHKSMILSLLAPLVVLAVWLVAATVRRSHQPTEVATR